MYRAYDNWHYDGGRQEPRPDRVTPPEAKLAGDEWDGRSAIGLQTLIHPLVFCPPLPRGTRYRLVERSWPGLRVVLAEGQATFMQEGVNLAVVRKTAATLGANEVHILPR